MHFLGFNGFTGQAVSATTLTFLGSSGNLLHNPVYDTGTFSPVGGGILSENLTDSTFGFSGFVAEIDVLLSFAKVMEARCRYMLHETSWIPKDVRTAPATSCGSLGRGLVCAGGGASYRRIGFFCLPLEDGSGGGWRGSVISQIGSRAPEEAARRRTTTTCRTVVAGGHGLRLSQRSVDPETHCLGDSQGVRRGVSSKPRLASPPPDGLVLSSSGTARHPTRREGHRALEAVQVAAYKKTRNDLGPTWPSSMKAASCSSRRAAGLGGHRDRPLSSATATNTTASRRWLRSPSPLFENASGSMFASSRTTSRPFMWPSFSGNFCTTCADTSSFFGIKRESTRAHTLRKSAATTLACIWNAFPHTHLNSILSNRSGMISKATQPTACRATDEISETCFMPIPVECGVPRPSCAPSSLCPTCLHHHDTSSITFAKLNKLARGPRTGFHGELCESILLCQ